MERCVGGCVDADISVDGILAGVYMCTVVHGPTLCVGIYRTTQLPRTPRAGAFTYICRYYTYVYIYVLCIPKTPIWTHFVRFPTPIHPISGIRIRIQVRRIPKPQNEPHFGVDNGTSAHTMDVRISSYSIHRHPYAPICRSQNTVKRDTPRGPVERVFNKTVPFAQSLYARARIGIVHRGYHG